ncbi:hypothetical protein [Streptomyces sp. NPDC002671]
MPTYEVKIDLTTAALDASHAPTAAVKAAFGITGSAKARSYEYYDTDALDLNAQGWDARLRPCPASPSVRPPPSRAR